MIAILMLLAVAAAGAILRWSLSSNDPRELIGAGQGRIDWLEVQWPAQSHRADRIASPAPDRYLTLTEGGGT